MAAFGVGAETMGVFFERAASGKRTASAGWYNSAAFECAAHEAGLYAKSFNGDAFSDTLKEQVIQTIKKDWGGAVDLVIYSIAAPRRQDPKTGEIFNSVLKPIGKAYQNKTVDVMTGQVSDIVIEPATTDEIKATEAVMGGEDWVLWMDTLLKEKLLAKNAATIAFTYIGPEITHPIYRNGTIGKAKEHLEATAHKLNKKMQQAVKGQALISVNKALITQASAAIPVVPLYISLLYKIMKAKDVHEGCIEQIYGLMANSLYGSQPTLDDEGRLRADGLELRPEVQQAVAAAWNEVTTENLRELTDFAGYRDEFMKLFGFNMEGVDYDADVDPNVTINNMV